MATISPGRQGEIIDILDGYAGDNVWCDVIRGIAEFDEAETERIDPACMSDCFVAGDTEFRWYEGRGWWVMTLPPGESGR